MAQGDFAPEMMSSTKLSTVSAPDGGGRGRNGKGHEKQCRPSKETASVQRELNIRTAWSSVFSNS